MGRSVRQDIPTTPLEPRGAPGILPAEISIINRVRAWNQAKAWFHGSENQVIAWLFDIENQARTWLNEAKYQVSTWLLKYIYMKEKDILRIEQMEEVLAPFRLLVGVRVPKGGWVKAIQETLGITNVQLAKRTRKAPQTVEDMQEYEALGTIKLETLRKLAEALECHLVYAVVPKKPLEEMRQIQARKIARGKMKGVSHTMRLEDQSISKEAEQRQYERLVAKLLSGNPKKLWE